MANVAARTETDHQQALPPVPVALAKAIAQCFRGTFVRRAEQSDHLDARQLEQRACTYERQRHSAPHTTRIVELYLRAPAHPLLRNEALLRLVHGRDVPEADDSQGRDGHYAGKKEGTPHDMTGSTRGIHNVLRYAHVLNEISLSAGSAIDMKVWGRLSGWAPRSG